MKLLPLPELDQERGPREIGTALHDALEQFEQRHPSGPLPADARDELIALAREKLAELAEDPEFLAFRWPRLLQGLDAFLAFEAQRRPLVETLAVEVGGRLTIPLEDGSDFALTAKADRIEVLKDGFAAIVDYKSGRPPSDKEVRAGWSPQLTLEAAMLERGAFRGVGARAADRRVLCAGRRRRRQARVGSTPRTSRSPNWSPSILANSSGC